MAAAGTTTSCTTRPSTCSTRTPTGSPCRRARTIPKSSPPTSCAFGSGMPEAARDPPAHDVAGLDLADATSDSKGLVVSRRLSRHALAAHLAQASADALVREGLWHRPDRGRQRRSRELCDVQRVLHTRAQA